MQIDKFDRFIPGKTRIKYGGAYTDEDDFKAIQSVLDRNWWTIDEHARELESELAEFVNMRKAVLTNSGSSALLVALAGMKDFYGWDDETEVITGSVHFPTTISSMYYSRLVPVYLDNDISSLGISEERLEKAITDKTKAIMLVNIAGSIQDITNIVSIARKHDLKVILDNCDGFGGTFNNQAIDKMVDVSCTSFHAAHIMNMGEGGAILTDDVDLADVFKSMREWGRIGDTDSVSDYDGIPDDYPGRYIFKHLGFNLKPLELQCAMGRTQLKKLPEIKRLRLNNYATLYDGLEGMEDVTLIKTSTKAQPSWFSFPMIVKRRGELRDFLEERQIETRTIFGGNITEQPAFKGFGHIRDYLINTKRVMTDGMFVSVHPNNTPEMMNYIVKSIREFYAKS